MARLVLSLFILLALVPAACDTRPAASEAPQFASFTDTVCHMPVREDAKDTIILNNKILGFCSSKCRDGFMQILKEQGKR